MGREGRAVLGFFSVARLSFWSLAQQVCILFNQSHGKALLLLIIIVIFIIISVTSLDWVPVPGLARFDGVPTRPVLSQPQPSPPLFAPSSAPSPVTGCRGRLTRSRRSEQQVRGEPTSLPPLRRLLDSSYLVLKSLAFSECDVDWKQRKSGREEERREAKRLLAFFLWLRLIFCGMRTG